MTPYFSIIIPVFNTEPYLRECLNSVCAQTFTDWEAICVDDGSTDGSGKILDEYAVKDSRFRVIHQSNAGVSAARNKGLDNAKGEWIWFVDSDDSIKSIALETFAAITSKADITFFSMELKYQDGFNCAYFLKPVPTIELTDSSSADVLALMKNSLGVDTFGWTWDKIFRREIIVKNLIRFDENISFFEDEIFTLEVLRRAKSFSCLNEVFYQFRILASSLTRSRKWDYLPIGRRFIIEGVSARWEGLREIAFQRAIYFMKCALRQRKGYFVAIELLRAEKSYGIFNKS